MPTPQDALNYAKRFIGRMPLDDTDIKLRILDDASAELWMAAPWPWSVSMLEVVTMTNDVQDYSLSSYTDLLCLQHVSQTNGQEKTDLAISSILPSTSVIKGRPSQIMYIPGSPQKLRLLPVPTGYPGGSLPNILTVYKKIAPIIDGSNIATSYLTTTGVHDAWFWVYESIVLRKAFEFSHDPRLGSIQTGPNGTIYTGQYAVVMDGIAKMKESEEKFLNTLGQEVTNRG